MSVILVTGDRDWTDGAFIHVTLDHYFEDEAEGPIETLFEGCARGADIWAGDHEWYDPALGPQMNRGWLRDLPVNHGVATRHFPADWGAFRPARNRPNPAGPIRNRAMLRAALDAGLTHVLAFHDDFPHSRGTRDMVTIARAAQVRVTLFSHAKTVTYDPALTLPLDL